MIEITEDSMIDFVKLLLEYANVFEVDENRVVRRRNEDNDPVAIEVVGGKTLPMRVFKEGDEREGYAYLHPFKESCTNTSARSWFYHTVTDNVLVLLKKIMLKTMELAAGRSSDDPDQMKILQKIMENTDKTTVSEMEKINIKDLVTIAYNKKQKKACLYAFHLLPETQEKYPKIRKKTWQVIDTLISTFLDEDDFEDPEVLSFTATLLNIPETEAKLHVVISTLIRLEPYAKLFLDKDVHTDKLMEHIKLLSGYNKLHLYLNADNTMPMVAQQTVAPVNPIGTPFGQQVVFGGQQQMVTAPEEPKKPNKAPDLGGLGANTGVGNQQATLQQQQVVQPQQQLVVQQPQVFSPPVQQWQYRPQSAFSQSVFGAQPAYQQQPAAWGQSQFMPQQQYVQAPPWNQQQPPWNQSAFRRI